MQSTLDSVDLQTLSAYEFNKLPALVRTELLASGKLGTKTKSRNSLVRGVGRNDASYPVVVCLHGVKVSCPAYKVWENMLSRCYSPSYQHNRKTYIGCTVHSDWHSFTQFRVWWLLNYVDGWELDKDLLVMNNRIYSEATCLFVPKWLNNLTLAHNAGRGSLPIGVTLNSGRLAKPYQAQSSDGTGKRVHLGRYTTPEAAYMAWLEYKLQFIDSRSLELESILPGLHGKVRAKVLSLR